MDAETFNMSGDAIPEMKKTTTHTRPKRNDRTAFASRFLRSVARLLGLPATAPGKPKRAGRKTSPHPKVAPKPLRPETSQPSGGAERAGCIESETKRGSGSRRGSRPNTHAKARPVAPTKAETALLLPFAGLPPDRIHLPKTKAECEAAAGEILAAGVAGFDTEAKPTFRAGEKSAGPHVVQFALTDRAYIFQLHRRECIDAVAGLIESSRVLKVGFGLKNDHGQIRNRLGVTPDAVLDLDYIFRKMGYPGQIGVRAAMGAVLKLGFPKSKSTTTSNWAAAELTPRQLAYAANDAFAALKIMEALDLKPPFDSDTAHAGAAKKSRSARRGRRRSRR